MGDAVGAAGTASNAHSERLEMIEGKGRHHVTTSSFLDWTALSSARPCLCRYWAPADSWSPCLEIEDLMQRSMNVMQTYHFCFAAAQTVAHVAHVAHWARGERNVNAFGSATQMQSQGDDEAVRIVVNLKDHMWAT